MIEPIQRTVDWLLQNLASMPAGIRMAYAESSEHTTPQQKVVASFQLFCFRHVPDGGFDPDNDDHVADLGDWDWEANPWCDFPDFNYEAIEWLEVLRDAINDLAVVRVAEQRGIIPLFADHDGPITVVMRG